MANCETKKIDSNIVGLSILEEECLGKMPEEAKRVWQVYEPNSFSDLGASLDTVARTPISQSRQNKKGTVTGMSVSGGFNTDVTQDNLFDLFQGLFFADKRSKANFDKITEIKTNAYMASAGMNKVKANDLILAKGFKNEVNNGLKVVKESTDTSITVTQNNLVDSTGQSDVEKGSLQVVGHQFDDADAKFKVANGIYSLETTTKNLTELGLIEGEWIFIGGDEEATKFAMVPPCFARIKSIEQNKIVFGDGTYRELSGNDEGVGKTIQIFFGSIIKNEHEPALIKRRSYTMERTLGKDTVSNQEQAEYIHGAVFGQFTLNVNQGEMLKGDLSFTATDNQQRIGSPLSFSTNSKRIPALGQEGINTTLDIKAMRLSLKNNLSRSKPLFAYLTELSLEFNNNLTENKAIGVFGAIDVSAGNFEVKGSSTAYFTNVQAIQAVRQNADVGLFTIFAKANAGFMFDIPLVGLGGGQVKVEKDNPITISLEANGAENEFGYTAMYVNFHYLPMSAM